MDESRERKSTAHLHSIIEDAIAESAAARLRSGMRPDPIFDPMYAFLIRDLHPADFAILDDYMKRAERPWLYTR